MVRFAVVREIFKSNYFVVYLDDEHKIVRRQRTELGLTANADIELAYAELLGAVELLHQPNYTLLADLRLAPPRNDPTYEGIARRYYDRLYAGFRKIAIVVKTEAGRLQVRRFATPKVAARMRAFTTEQAALDFLLKG